MKLKPNETKSDQGPTRWSEKALEPDLWSFSSHPPLAQKSHMAVTKIDVGRVSKLFLDWTCAVYNNLNQYGTKLAMTKAWDGTRLRWRGTEKKQDGDDRRPRWRLGPVQCSRCTLCIQCTKCTLCTVTRDHAGFGGLLYARLRLEWRRRARNKGLSLLQLCSEQGLVHKYIKKNTKTQKQMRAFHHCNSTSVREFSALCSAQWNTNSMHGTCL